MGRIISIKQGIFYYLALNLSASATNLYVVTLVYGVQEFNLANRTDETVISIAVLRILKDTPNGEANIRSIKKKIPNYVQLTDEDKKESQTRLNEPMWEQILRNIKSHKNSPNNVIANGLLESRGRGQYKITEAGRLHVANL